MKPVRTMRTAHLMEWIACLAAAAGWLDAGVVKGKVQCRGAHDNRDAVVYLEEVKGTFAPPKEPPVIDQIRMEFVPHVLPILIGTTVRFLNSDPVMHNVYTPSTAGNRFNLGTWPKGQAKTYTFYRLGDVPLLCNVHPEMEAWILVLPNPFFAKTAPDGEYMLRAVPAGSYQLKIWHEKMKCASVPVVVTAEEELVKDAVCQ